MKIARDDGYSLIEVLITFTILVSVLSVLIPTNLSLFMTAPKANERLLALDYAQSRFATLGISRPIKLGEHSGKYNENWYWNEEISLYDIDTNLPVYSITIAILNPSNETVASMSGLKVSK